MQQTKQTMSNSEAILRIKDHIEVHKLKEPQAVYISEALELAIKALEIQAGTEDECGEQTEIDKNDLESILNISEVSGIRNRHS